MNKVIKTGNGWRFGYSGLANSLMGLIGGENWSIELTANELNDFCRLVHQLIDQIEYIATELMDEEKFTVELESDLIWLEARGDLSAYTLQVILQTGRRCEGIWPPEAVLELLQVVNHDQFLITF